MIMCYVHIHDVNANSRISRALQSALMCLSAHRTVGDGNLSRVAIMKVAAHLTAVSLLLQLCSVIGYNATGDDDYYYAYYDEYDSYYDYYDDYGGESTLGSNSDVFTVVVDDDGTPIMEIVEAVRSLSPADVNASAAAAANFLSAYEDESDGYKEDPEVESKPMRKYGYEKSSIDESRVIEEQLMVGSMRHSVMNDTISMIACIPKHDIRGSRASGTEEMMLIKDIREKEREEDLIFSRRGKLTLKELQDVRLKKRQEESQGIKENRLHRPNKYSEILAHHLLFTIYSQGKDGSQVPAWGGLRSPGVHCL